MGGFRPLVDVWIVMRNPVCVCVCVCGGVAGWVQMEEAAKTMIRAGCARPRGEFRRSVAGGAGGANFFYCGVGPLYQ
jgi:hypothetical protein